MSPDKAFLLFGYVGSRAVEVAWNVDMRFLHSYRAVYRSPEASTFTLELLRSTDVGKKTCILNIIIHLSIIAL